MAQGPDSLVLGSSAGQAQSQSGAREWVQERLDLNFLGLPIAPPVPLQPCKRTSCGVTLGDTARQASPLYPFCLSVTVLPISFMFSDDVQVSGTRDPFHHCTGELAFWDRGQRPTVNNQHPDGRCGLGLRPGDSLEFCREEAANWKNVTGSGIAKPRSGTTEQYGKGWKVRAHHGHLQHRMRAKVLSRGSGWYREQGSLLCT